MIDQKRLAEVRAVILQAGTLHPDDEQCRANYINAHGVSRDEYDALLASDEEAVTILGGLVRAWSALLELAAPFGYSEGSRITLDDAIASMPTEQAQRARELMTIIDRLRTVEGLDLDEKR